MIFQYFKRKRAEFAAREAKAYQEWQAYHDRADKAIAERKAKEKALFDSLSPFEKLQILHAKRIACHCHCEDTDSESYKDATFQCWL